MALAVCCASVLTSDATTANPRPAAPARAASIVALSASSEVCEAIASISLTTAPMRSAAAARLRTVRSVRARSATLRSVASLATAASAAVLTISASNSRAASATAATSRLAAGRGLDRDRGPLQHILVAFAEVGGGDADFLAGRLEKADELVDGGAEPLGEETAAGMVQPRFRLAAAMIDRQRIGIDQHLPHPFGSSGTVCERSAADPGRQRGITVAAGNLRDRTRQRAQCPLEYHAAQMALIRAAANPANRLPVSQAVSADSVPAEAIGRSIQAGRNFLKKSKSITGGFQIRQRISQCLMLNCADSITKPFPKRARQRMNCRRYAQKICFAFAVRPDRHNRNMT